MVRLNGNGDDDSYRSAEITDSRVGELKSIAHCFYSIRFWQFFFSLMLCHFSPTFFTYTFKTYGMDSQTHPPINDITLTWAASLGAGVVNGVSRIFFGWLMDKVSFKKIYGFLTCVALVNACVQYWAAWYPMLYFTCILVNYMYIGGCFAIMPTQVQNVFGLKQGPQIYVWVLLGSTLTAVLCLLATHFLIEMLSFAMVFYIGAMLEVVVLINLVFFFDEKLDTEHLIKMDALVI